MIGYQLIDESLLKDRSSRSAMTLFEVLAALLLGAILLASLSGVIHGFTSQARAIDDSVASGWQDRLASRIRWDLLNARRIRVTSNRLMLEGHADRDVASGRPTFLPSRVIYSLRTIGRERWLLRSAQSVGNGGASSAPVVEHMASGVHQLLAGRGDDRIVDMQIETGANMTYDIPAHARVVLLDGADRPVVDVVIGRMLEVPE